MRFLEKNSYLSWEHARPMRKKKGKEKRNKKNSYLSMKEVENFTTNEEERRPKKEK